MKNKQAFTLVEVLISLFISSFIIFGMLQLYRNLQNFIDKTYVVMKTNRKVYALFSQLEKDFSTAFIPKFSKAEEETKDKEIEKEEKQNYFKGEIVDGEYKSIKGQIKRLELFKNLNFISTNALFVYDEKNVKLVRIGYFLEKNKELSKSDRFVYNLYRKESLDLSNKEFTQDESIFKKDKKNIVKVFLVAQNIKHFSIEYYGFEKEDEKKDNKQLKKEEVKMINSFVWGNNPKTENVIPQKMVINVSFWDDKFISESAFSSVVNTFIFALKVSESEKKLLDDQKQEHGHNGQGVDAKANPVK
ncbi:MAG: prepilin-type N-terminal cleavage/methylation domain-containing protein [bacterium]